MCGGGDRDGGEPNTRFRIARKSASSALNTSSRNHAWRFLRCMLGNYSGKLQF